MIDLAPEHLAIVRRILAARVPLAEVRAFGSRVRGEAKPWSDLDLVIIGDARMTPRELGELREAFEESTLPMRIDLVDWHATSPAFREVIAAQAVSLMEPRER
jgi:type I restriction enzyme S subunit